MVCYYCGVAAFMGVILGGCGVAGVIQALFKVTVGSLLQTALCYGQTKFPTFA